MLITENCSREDKHRLVYDLSSLVIAFATSRQARRLIQPGSTYDIKELLTDRISRIINATKVEIEQLLLQEPIFYKNEPTAEKLIDIDDEIRCLLPEDFFKDPTGWIESQPNIERKDLPTSIDSISQLCDTPYDVSKVKQINLGSVIISSKRISDPAEILRARRAYNAGIPTPKVLGIVVDKGNIYAFFEKINGINLNEIEEKQRQLLQAHSPLKRFMSDFRELCERMRCPRPEGLSEDDLEKMDIASLAYFTFYMAQSLGIIKQPTDDSSAVLKKFIQSAFNLPPPEQILDAYSLYLETLSSINRYLGFYIDKEIAKLRTMCRQKGINHKDLEPRNIVIEWDFENDRPIQGRKPLLYIIDWEPQENPEYDPIRLDLLWVQFKTSWQIFNTVPIS